MKSYVFFVKMVEKRFLIFHQSERQVIKINQILRRYSNDMTTALDQKNIRIYDCPKKQS
ncbi:hypothetical protein HMPREF0322_04903 [Desulfitobacterium hafniense DP7]|uniref:Uncharacterized protein n=1 Tax=Desulfitobacterium hafniense DP7 TaxID=537010 RepID=G9XV90_DESHA|nr:hypothetical protein HMPREF0322_04903 [Desulfitobacterium hafniense DP7]